MPGFLPYSGKPHTDKELVSADSKLLFLHELGACLRIVAADQYDCHLDSSHRHLPLS
jgi:hypothetical protein